MIQGRKSIVELLTQYTDLVMNPSPVNPGPQGLLTPSLCVNWRYQGVDKNTGQIVISGPSGHRVTIPDGLLIGAHLGPNGVVEILLAHSLLIYGDYYSFVGERFGGRGFFSGIAPIETIILDPKLPENNSGLLWMSGQYARNNKFVIVLQIGGMQICGDDVSPIGAEGKMWALHRHGTSYLPFNSDDVSSITFLKGQLASTEARPNNPK